MNEKPQIRLLERLVIKVSEDAHPIYRYAMVTEESEDCISGHYLEKNCPVFFFSKPYIRVRIHKHSDTLLTSNQLQILTTLEQELNIWYQYTEEDPYDKVKIDNSALIVETAENVGTYSINHIVAAVKYFSYPETVITLTTGDKLSLHLKNETYKALIAAILGQTKSSTLNL